MNWIPIHWNLVDARMRMWELVAQVECAAFGKVCDETHVRTKAELGRSLHRIYSELNDAWAVRKPGRIGSADRGTARRRNRFPKAFPQLQRV